MYNKRTVGSEFEQIAVQHLIGERYQIIETNFQCRTGEIDIIAKDKEYLVFVEVKYRTNTDMGLPQEAVDLRKMKKISRTAQYYMLTKGLSMDTPCRFDVITILNQDITLIKNAFDAFL
jgi:putative endonuclease